jgi:hypothetical protein
MRITGVSWPVSPAEGYNRPTCSDDPAVPQYPALAPEPLLLTSRLLPLPSGARRMKASASHLVERVRPPVPGRQFVLPLPLRLFVRRSIVVAEPGHAWIEETQDWDGPSALPCFTWPRRRIALRPARMMDVASPRSVAAFARRRS